MDREIVGGPVRIEIPFFELYRLREVGDMLAGYNASIQNLTRRTDLSPRSILLELHCEAVLLAKRIKYLYPQIYGRGRK